MVAWKIVAMNDIELDGKWNARLQRFVDLTPEDRYLQMLDWVRRNIIPEKVA